MEKYCYNLAIRQRRCQNSISSTLDNVCTNVADDFVFELSFGYSLRIVSLHENFVAIEISNPPFFPPIIFHIPNEDFRTFDLPLLNGTFVVSVGARRTNRI